MPELSERLISLRKAEKMPQKEVADAIGIALRSLRYYESGERKPTSDIVISLANFFQVSADYLLGISSIPRNSDVMLPESEQNILQHFRDITDEGQDYVRLQMTMAVNMYKKKRKRHPAVVDKEISQETGVV